ncbi:MAG: hypothetical protein U0361_15495 [Nitrospiraceae bacterium]
MRKHGDLCECWRARRWWLGAKVVPALVPLLTREQDENVRYHVRETLTAVDGDWTT